MQTTVISCLTFLSLCLAGCPGGGGGSGGGAGGGSPAPHCGKAPTVLVSGVDQPASLAVDGLNVYWQTADMAPAQTATSPFIMKAPLSGGTPTALVNRSAYPTPPYELTANLAVAGDNAYFASQVLMAVPASGGTPTVISPGSVRALGADATNVYWAEVSGAILEAPLTGGASVALVSQASTTVSDVRSIALSSKYLFWNELHIMFTNPMHGVSWGELHRVALDGASPVKIAANAVVDGPGGGISAIAANDSYVYWADRNGVQSMPVNGGATTLLLADDQVDSMAADSSGLYLIHASQSSQNGEYSIDWTLITIPLGGTPKNLATGTSTNPYAPGEPGLALDAECIYWSDSGANGTIHTMAK